MKWWNSDESSRPFVEGVLDSLRFSFVDFLPSREGISDSTTKSQTFFSLPLMEITQRIFIQPEVTLLWALQSNFYERFFRLFFPPSRRRSLQRALGEIVNKIMISLMEIYYPSNIGLGIGAWHDNASWREKKEKAPNHISSRWESRKSIKSRLFFPLGIILLWLREGTYRRIITGVFNRIRMGWHHQKSQSEADSDTAKVLFLRALEQHKIKESCTEARKSLHRKVLCRCGADGI